MTRKISLASRFCAMERTPRTASPICMPRAQLFAAQIPHAAIKKITVQSTAIAYAAN